MKRSNTRRTLIASTAKPLSLALAMAFISVAATAFSQAPPTKELPTQPKRAKPETPQKKPAKSAEPKKTAPSDSDKNKTSKPADKTDSPELEKTSKPPTAPALADEEDAFEQIELFTRVLELVRQSYVDPDKTTYKKLISSALEGMLADLDPHSQFMHAKVFEQLKKKHRQHL